MDIRKSVAYDHVILNHNKISQIPTKKFITSQQLSPQTMKRTGMFGGNMTSTDPSDAYSDRHQQNFTQNASHAELEEILAIPNDGKKLLNQNSFQKYESNII